MGILRKLRGSWCMVTITILLATLLYLRSDLQSALEQYDETKTRSVFKSEPFDDYVSRHGVRSVLSQSGRYMTYPDVLLPLQKIPPYDVTIATHCTYYNLRYLPNLVKSWEGPVSVAVFTSNPTKTFIIIDLLQKCSPEIRYFASFHIVVPFFGLKYTKMDNLAPGEPNILKILERFREKRHYKNLICDNLDSLLQSFENIEKNYELIDFLDYPNNVLRNVAWQHSKTKHVLNIDIDLLPSQDLHELLPNYLKMTEKSTQKTAFVVPAFEIQRQFYHRNKKEFPISKDTLLKYLKNGAVRPFYSEVCPKCQSCVNYEAWYDLDTDTTELTTVDYKILMKPPCEPYLILPRVAPNFDERFAQYGYNRMGQICELSAAGYHFKVLDNAFLIHLGFKRDSELGFHSSKESEHGRNEILFSKFNDELHEKYPHSDSFCF